MAVLVGTDYIETWKNFTDIWQYDCLLHFMIHQTTKLKVRLD